MLSRRILESSVPSVVHPDDPSLTIARVELGLTLYLAEPLAWAREGAARVLDALRAVVPPSYLRFYVTSHLSGWRDATDVREIAQALSIPWSAPRPRHLFELSIADDVEAPSSGLHYQEIDAGRAKRAGVIEVTLPQELDPGYLLPVARAALAAGPLYAGIGGYTVRLGERYRADAFDVAWAWAQRYTGVDIQDTERMVWPVTQGLAGSSWLTIAGAALATRIDLAALGRASFIDPDVRAEQAAGNLMLIAGAEPSLGDVHRAEDLSAYREVAAALGPHFVKRPPVLAGRFDDERATRAWFRRLVEPEAWERAREP